MFTKVFSRGKILSKCSRLLFSTVCVASLGLFPAFAQNSQMQEVINIAPGDSLNGRTGPRHTAPDVADIPNGQFVNVIGYDISGKWARISWGNKTVWVSAKYLSGGIHGQNMAQNQNNGLGPHIVTGALAVDRKGLALRDGPGTQHALMQYVGDNVEVHVVQRSRDGKWAFVRLPNHGAAGWVFAKYLAPANNSANTPPPPAPDQNRLGGHLVTFIQSDDPDGGLNMRTGPSTKYPVMGVLPFEACVDVQILSPDKKWSFVQSDFGSGHVRNKFLVKALDNSDCAARYDGGNQGNNVPNPPREMNIDPDGNALPAVYNAYDFAANDRLFIRNAPNARGARIGSLALDAPIVVLAWLSNGWARISYGEEEAFVNGDFLRPGSGPALQNGFPLGLVCRGTEPFWSLDIPSSGQTVTYRTPDQPNNPQTIGLQATFPDLQTGNYPYTFKAGRKFGVINQQACSDGMSDIGYGWRLELTHTQSDGSTYTQYGCCTLN